MNPESPDRDESLEVLRKDALFARVEGDAALLSAMAAIFLHECPKHLADIRKAVANHDAPGLQATAHHLRGSVSNFLAPQAVQAALTLETMGRDGDLTKSKSALLALEGAIARLKTALEELK